MILKLKRTPGIYLTGFMGCGKSTVGELLADILGWPFVDLDASIEKEQGVTIAQIFEQSGEAAFREIESAALQKIVRVVGTGQPRVLALGGGTFAQEKNRAMLSECGVSIWLDCPFDVVANRVAGYPHRPLARDPEKFRRLFNDRRDSYSLADHHIDAARDNASAVVAKIMNLNLF